MLSQALRFVLLWTALCFAALVNVTVDDTDSSAWAWSGAWNAITEGNPCQRCTVHADGKQAFNHSWHDGLLLSGAFTFRGLWLSGPNIAQLTGLLKGVAVYIYGIDIDNPANVTFSLNNPSLSAFHYKDTGLPQKFLYNSLFFAAHGLDGTQEHTILFGETAVPQPSPHVPGKVALLDYAVVTIDQEALPGPPSGPSQPSQTLPTSLPASRPGSTGMTGLIVGGILGGLAAVAFPAGAVVLVLSRRKRRRSANTAQLTQSNRFPPSITIPSTVLSSEPSPRIALHNRNSNPYSDSPARAGPATTRPNQIAEVERRLRVLEELAQVAPPSYK
ncbi:hypothetical protein MIND_00149400 [Mycena indigotica]|uniref:Uncharacterized protein n=1 Tax=Mycena indigotica TaxID=2126181 RepID=A0A8H6WG03_9AGAR|nr:uncharacterized protein MIND_00149400 [Mycena indigotica]KAF7316307.1 hypothetical protein MIND_00149400 [Mycena indigotica]